VRALFHRDAVAGEIRDELRFHVQARTEQFERAGMTPADARREALRRVGNLALHQDHGYDVRGGGIMETIWQDARYAWRLLRKQPGFSIVAVLTLALGIGASTAIFSVIDAALLRPLPYPHPEQLVEINIEVDRPGRPQPSRFGPSVKDMRQFQTPDGPLASIATWDSVMFGRIVDGAEPERVEAIEISESYLSLHGLAPLVGRGFNADDMREGAPDVVLLGHGYWLSRFGGDRDVVGRTIRFDDRSATIVGVLPPSAWKVPIWRPLQLPAGAADRRGSGRQMLGRLKSGVTLEQARQQLTALVDDEPGPDATTLDARVHLTSLLDDARGEYGPTVEVIAGAVGLILLIACVNVAGLLLARGATRHSELAVRASIGAGRGRLVRQLLMESLVLSVIGGALGVLVAWVSLDALVANIPMSLPSNSPAALNLKVLSASVALALVTGLVFGLVPALRLSRVQIGAAMAQGQRRHGPSLGRRGGQLLIATEIALAVVLVAGAGLMLRSFSRLLAVDMGFIPESIVTMEVTPLDPNPAAQARYYPDLLRSLRAIPGVAAAGAVDHMPLAGSSTVTSATIDGRRVTIGIRQALPGYFEAMGIPLRQGRLLTDQDHAASLPAAIVNEAAAHAMFPDGQVVGRQFIVNKQTYSVIGVVADIRHGGPLGRVSSEVFTPFQAPTSTLHRALALTVVVRPDGRAPGLAQQLRVAAQNVGPRVLVERIRTGEEWMGVRVVTPRRRTVLLGLLGALGLVLAIVGVFGMTAYSVSRRTQEIGIRMAFGAEPAVMVRHMVRDSAIPILIGTAAGLGAAAMATRMLATFLFETAPIDRATFAAVSIVLVAAGCLAAWLPARRAARVDPVAALRAD